MGESSLQGSKKNILDAYSSTLIFNLSSPNNVLEWLLRDCPMGSGTMGQWLSIGSPRLKDPSGISTLPMRIWFCALEELEPEAEGL